MHGRWTPDGTPASCLVSHLQSTESCDPVFPGEVVEALCHADESWQTWPTLLDSFKPPAVKLPPFLSAHLCAFSPSFTFLYLYLNLYNKICYLLPSEKDNNTLQTTQLQSDPTICFFLLPKVKWIFSSTRKQSRFSTVSDLSLIPWLP